MRTANEGAARRVLMIAGFLLLAANLRAALTSVGPLLETIRADIGLTAGEAGFIGTLPLLTFAAVSPQVPRLARRVGTDRLLWLALVLLATGIVLRSLPVTGLLWAGTVALGAAIAAGNVLLPSLIKRDFPDHVSAVTGVYTAVIGIVASTAAGIAVPLAGALPGGWRTALGCWAGFVLIALAVWTPRLSRRNQPPLPDEGRAATPWRSLLAWECAAFMALSATGFYTVLSWYPSILVSYGTSEVAAGWLLFAYQMIGVLMSLVVPLLLTRLADQRAVAAVSSLLAMIGYLGLLIAPELAVLWVLTTGVGAGALFFLALAFFSLRAADPRSSAALSGMGQSIGYLVAAVGPTLFGALHDATGGWRVPLGVLVGVAAAHTLIGLRAGRDAHVKV
ncbi:CynX/NimT family MFS transporter [Actinophytocola glycyrrhizae]|uniref:CynX/NimT family MFS transporter n=1 Tax=Actinophytocola glycyrrhizae TaxID=2044873 RepID=A0ABV9S3Q7_9PSEU